MDVQSIIHGEMVLALMKNAEYPERHHVTGFKEITALGTVQLISYKKGNRPCHSAIWRWITARKSE